MRRKRKRKKMHSGVAAFLIFAMVFSNATMARVLAAEAADGDQAVSDQSATKDSPTQNNADVEKDTDQKPAKETKADDTAVFGDEEKKIENTNMPTGTDGETGDEGNASTENGGSQDNVDKSDKTSEESIQPKTDDASGENSDSDLVAGEEINLSNDVKITFTKLPDNPGKIDFKEIKLSAEEMKKTGALSDTLYEITSDMKNGTFKYNLTLPLPKNADKDKAEVKYAESESKLDDLKDVSGEKTGSNSITISGLDHFTVFGVFAEQESSNAPVLIEVTPIDSISNDNTPSYVFNSDQAGTIFVGGSCSGGGSAIVGDNTITFGPLADGIYDDCFITVTNSSHQASNPLVISSFSVDTTQGETETELTGSFTSAELVNNNTDVILHGTVSDPDAEVALEIYRNATDLAYFGDAINNGDGTWTLPSGSIEVLNSGIYDLDMLIMGLNGDTYEQYYGHAFTIEGSEGTLEVTVNTVNTENTSPQLSGTISDPDASISIQVLDSSSSQVFSGDATNNGDGTWTLESGSIDPPLAPGIYDVKALATDNEGNPAYDETTNELTVTNSGGTSILSSIIVSPSSESVFVGENQTFIAQGYDQFGLPFATSYSWDTSDHSIATIDNTGKLTGIAAGSVTVTATSGSIYGEASVIIVEHAPTVPTITVNNLITNDTSPTITGTVDDPSAIISITVDGRFFSGINNEDGTWDAFVSESLLDGTYNVYAQATNDQGAGLDTTTDELTIDTVKPVVTLNAPANTDNKSPELTGTVDDHDATVSVYVHDSSTYTFQGNAVNNHDGTWTLPAGTINPQLVVGTYTISVAATDLAGNVSDPANGQIIIVAVPAPVISEKTPVAALINFSSPQYAFTSDQAGTINYGGDCSSATTQAATGDNQVTFNALADGVHDNCTISVTNPDGNTSNVLNLSSFTIDTVAPTITVDTLSKFDLSPALSGTINDPSATISVIVTDNSQNVVYSGNAVNNAGGTWSIDAGTLPQLALGTYDVKAVATDTATNSSEAHGQLTIKETPYLASITVDPLTKTITVGDTQQFTAQAFDQYNEPFTADITWSTSDESIATIDASGLMTSVKDGTVTVTATSGTISGNAQVTVEKVPPMLTTINISPLEKSMFPGETQQFGAETLDQYGNPFAAELTWSTSDNSIATIDASGLLTSLSAGAVTVTATSGDISGTAQVTVNPSPVLTTINVSPASKSLIAGETQQFMATTLDQYSNPIEATVVWSTSDTSIATIDGSGMLTTVKDGTVTVMATSGEVSGTAEVTVNKPAPVVKEVNVIPQSPKVFVGTNEQFTAQVVDMENNVIDMPVTWSVSDNSLATIDASTGLLSATAHGTITVKATADGVEGTSEVTIHNPAPTIHEFVAVGEYVNSSTPGYAFSSNQAGNITYGGDCSSSTVSAHSGNNFITFNTMADGLHNNCTVVVTNSDGETSVVLPVSPFTIDTVEPVIFIDPLKTSDRSPVLTGTVDDPQAEVYLEVYNEDGDTLYAGDATNNGDGTWTLPEGTLSNLALGSYEVYATATDLAGNTGFDDTFIDIREPSVLTWIEVNPTTATLIVGGTQQFIAVPRDQYDDPMDAPITWSTSDETIATIDANGLLTAIKNGSVTVMATSGSVYESASVTVDLPAPVLTTINVSPLEKSMFPGETQQFGAETLDQYGNPFAAELTWSTSDNSIATIDASGLLTSLSAGAVTVTATSGDISGTAQVTVNPSPVLTTINVSPASKSLIAGETQQFMAATLDQYSNPIEATVTWSTSDSTIATIDESGMLTSIKDGTVTVTATSGEVSGTAEVVVEKVPPVLTTINVSPLNKSLIVGETQQYVAETLDQYGQSILADITWSTSDQNIATIDVNGMLTTVKDGTVTVTAASGSVSGTAEVVVNPIPDTTAPVLTAVKSIPAFTNKSNPEFTFNSSEAGNITYGGVCTSSTTQALVGDNTITFNTLSQGYYDSCTITVTDSAGNASEILNIPPFTVDLTSPLVTMSDLTTDESSPELTGTIDDPNALIQIDITVNDVTQEAFATNNGDGTWTLPSGTISPLATGNYTINVTAADEAGNETTTAGNLTVVAEEPSDNDNGGDHHHHHHHHKHHHHHHKHRYYGCEQFFNMYCRAPYDAACRAMMNYCPFNMPYAAYTNGNNFSWSGETNHENQLSLSADPATNSGSTGSELAMANTQTPQVQAAEAAQDNQQNNDQRTSGSNLGYWIVAVIILLGLAGGIGWSLYRVKP